MSKRHQLVARFMLLDLDLNTGPHRVQAGVTGISQLHDNLTELILIVQQGDALHGVEGTHTHS